MAYNLPLFRAHNLEAPGLAISRGLGHGWNELLRVAQRIRNEEWLRAIGAGEQLHGTYAIVSPYERSEREYIRGTTIAATKGKRRASKPCLWVTGKFPSGANTSSSYKHDGALRKLQLHLGLLVAPGIVSCNYQN